LVFDAPAESFDVFTSAMDLSKKGERSMKLGRGLVRLSIYIDIQVIAAPR
jgi:hypothetical protein